MYKSLFSGHFLACRLLVAKSPFLSSSTIPRSANIFYSTILGFLPLYLVSTYNSPFFQHSLACHLQLLFRLLRLKQQSPVLPTFPSSPSSGRCPEYLVFVYSLLISQRPTARHFWKLIQQNQSSSTIHRSPNIRYPAILRSMSFIFDLRLQSPVLQTFFSRPSSARGPKI